MAEEFKDQLMEDAARTQKQQSQSAEALGVKDVRQQEVKQKSLRIGNQVFNQQELNKVNNAINQTISRLTNEANFSNSLEKAKFQRLMQQRMNKLKLHMIREAGKAKLAAARQELDQRQQEALASALGRAAQVTTMAIAAGAGPSSNVGGVGDPASPDFVGPPAP